MAQWGSAGPAANMYVPQPSGAAHVGGPSSYAPSMGSSPSSSSLLRPSAGGGGGSSGSGGMGSGVPRKDWNITNDMMHQTWGTVLRTLNTNSTHSNSSSSSTAGAHGQSKGPAGYKSFGDEEGDDSQPMGRATMKRMSMDIVAKNAGHAPHPAYAPSSYAR